MKSIRRIREYYNTLSKINVQKGNLAYLSVDDIMWHNRKAKQNRLGA